MRFADRADAGRRLAEQAAHLRGPDVVVLAIPRGGVPVAAPVAEALGASLDVILVRKLGVPFQPELAMGAIGEDGVRVLEPGVMRSAGMTERDIAAAEHLERRNLSSRAGAIRERHPRVALEGKVAVIVDDGIATGSTARAAAAVARAHGARRVVLAVPVAEPRALRRLADDFDDVVAVETPSQFMAVGEWYDDFSQTTDDEVMGILDAAADRMPQQPSIDDEVRVEAGDVELPGHLTVAPDAKGVVVFVHGSGSSRHSPRNRSVARALNQAGMGTLLFDLLTPEEEDERANVFDIDLLGSRLAAVTVWLAKHPVAGALPVGYFGASTGAGAALWAAAEPVSEVSAIVSRGGRPDLAGDRLSAVRAPVLLIVGEHDPVVLKLNREARSKLKAESRLTVVPNATHLFEEPGTLDIVADLAREWFDGHFVGR